jgi:hypothetical protein
MNNLYKSLTLLLATALGHAAQAQDLTNSGAALTLSGGVTLYIGGALTNRGGTLDLSNGPNALLVSGNLTNASGATLAAGAASTVTLAGASAQRLDLNGATLANLTINNTGGGVTLPAGSNATVTGTLTLLSGLVTTDPSATLLLADGATLAGEQNGRAVRGNLAARRASMPAGTATTFPNGFALTPAAALSNLTVTRTAGLQAAQLSYGTNGSGTNKGIDQIWQTSAPVTGSVQLVWLGDNDNGLPNLARSQPWARRAAPVAGSDWALVGPAQDASATRTVVASVPAGSDFSFFTVSTTDAPLPVTLVSFTAERLGADGLLKWTTASELNNAYYQIESSADGVGFQPLGRVAGAGTSTQAHRYQFTDANLARYASGQVYYRLRQVDADGTGTYSPVRAVAVPMAAGWLAQVFPNPSGSAAPISLRLQTERGGEVQLTLSDALGRRVARQAAPLGAGTTTLPLDFAPGLPPGVYLLHVRQGAQQQVLKLVRQ